MKTAAKLILVLMLCAILVPVFTTNVSADQTSDSYYIASSGNYNGITNAISGSIVDLSDQKYIVSSYILNDRTVSIDTTDLNNKDTTLPATIGSNDTTFSEHLTLHPVVTLNETQAHVILDISKLDCDRFYSAVGIAAANGKSDGKGVVFNVYGRKNETDAFTLISNSGNVYGYSSGEFYLDITGYTQLKLETTITSDSKDHYSRTSSWCNVSVYKESSPLESPLGIPMFNTSGGSLLGNYDCGTYNGWNYNQITYSGTNSTEAAAYEAKLVSAGYTLHMSNTIGSNRFATYLKGDDMIHCNYFHALKQFRIIYGPKCYLGSDSPITGYSKIVTPSVSIIGMSDSVLCMVVQLADGSFVIIDGGWGTNANKSVTLNANTSSERKFSYYRDATEDMKNLWNFLDANTPAGSKPQVTWMITHADPDHITLPTKFLQKYAGKFDLNTVCYNFPNMYNIGLGEGSSTNDPSTFAGYANGFVNAVKTYFPNAKHMIHHTGQKLYLPGCEIEFLFCHEDYWPNSMPWCNHTSSAWRMTIEGKTILFTGDIETGLCDQMTKVFSSYLKSDILQVVHHGSNGATLSFYQKVQPKVCFWPCREEYIKYDLRHTGQKSGWSFNKYLWNTASAHYAGSQTASLLLPSLEKVDLTNGSVTAPEQPTEQPTEKPTEKPVQPPTEEPTETPTQKPTEAPTEAPTQKPTEAPTETPTQAPAETTEVTVQTDATETTATSSTTASSVPETVAPSSDSSDAASTPTNDTSTDPDTPNKSPAVLILVCCLVLLAAGITTFLLYRKKTSGK